MGIYQGLRSNRFPYTGVSVSPLDENLVDAFNRNFQQRLSLLQNVGESPNTKNIANYAWNQAIKEQQAPGLPESTINPFEVTPFPRTPDVSFIDFSTPQPRQLQPGDLFGPDSLPVRKGGLDSFFSIKNIADRKKIFGDLVNNINNAPRLQPGDLFTSGLTSAIKDLNPLGSNPMGFRDTKSRKAFEEAINNLAKQGLNPDQIAKQLFNNPAQGGLGKWYQPAAFQDLLNNAKQVGTRVADELFPGRHTVPEHLLDAIETPEFSQAVRNRSLNIPLGESTSLGSLSEKESKWLLDPRRTPRAGGGAFGSVVVPTNTQTAFKIQEGDTGLQFGNFKSGSKEFYENEVDKAIRTAELGYGPRVKSLTLQPIENDRYRAVTRTEAVPHRSYSLLSDAEKEFYNRDLYKLNENLMRGGILNKDSHINNVLLNDATKQLMQVDSGLAEDYDPTNIKHLYHRLRNIGDGMFQAGFPELSAETLQLGRGLLDELSRNPSPELYAEAENFFNRSGNILLKTPNEYPDLPKQNLIDSVADTTGISQPWSKSLKAGMRSAAGVSALDFIPSKEAVNRFTNEGLQGGAAQMAQDYASGIPMAVAMGAATTLVPAIGTAAAPVIGGAALIRGGEAINQAYLNATGKNFPTRNVVGQQGSVYAGPTPTIKPRTGTAILGGKPIQVPYGSVAGIKTVGRPWWDQVGSRIQKFADVLNRSSVLGR